MKLEQMTTEQKSEMIATELMGWDNFHLFDTVNTFYMQESFCQQAWDKFGEMVSETRISLATTEGERLTLAGWGTRKQHGSVFNADRKTAQMDCIVRWLITRRGSENV